jgi:predicted amidohydrolase
MPTTIAAAQIDITLADRERNLARMLDVLNESAKAGAAITVFPEAALSGYCFDSLDEATASPVPAASSTSSPSTASSNRTATASSTPAPSSAPPA